MAFLPKALIIIGLVLFGTIAGKVLLKKRENSLPTQLSSSHYGAEGETVEISLAEQPKQMSPKPEPKTVAEKAIEKKTQTNFIAEEPILKDSGNKQLLDKALSNDALPEADRIAGLFFFGTQKLPIVETISYKSHVPWQKGRPAWLSDYANHYATSRHFIARSLNGKPDYLKQEVKEGDKFNVFKLDRPITFHLVVDISRCKMWFFYHDLTSNERVLLKAYKVGVGRIDTCTASGLLTPLGCYKLGDKVATYKPKGMGHHNGQRQEMIRIFGTRWIPFSDEVRDCTAAAKGFGIHGVPWQEGACSALQEDLSSLGKHESDGCIRLSTADMEELFAIIITKPTTIEIVKDFFEAQLPGVEAKL